MLSSLCLTLQSAVIWWFIKKKLNKQQLRSYWAKIKNVDKEDVAASPLIKVWITAWQQLAID